MIVSLWENGFGWTKICFALCFFFFATVQVKEHGSCSICLKQKNLTHTQLLSPYFPMSDIIYPSQHSFSLNSDEALRVLLNPAFQATTNGSSEVATPASSVIVVCVCVCVGGWVGGWVGVGVCS